MAETEETVLARIRQYASEARLAETTHMDIESQELEKRLDETVRNLQTQVARQRVQVDELRTLVTTSFSPQPSQNRRQRLRQLQDLKTVYSNLGHSEPTFPSKGSAVPALLATRLIQTTITSTNSGIVGAENQIGDTTRKINDELANLSDARLLNVALQDRLARLRQQHEEHSQKTASQAARDLFIEEQRKTKSYQKEIESLERALAKFVDDHLGPMLAAEELGGPVVGDMMDFDDSDLAAGFSAQGKLKKKADSDQRRQTRIDEIWGSSLRPDTAKPLSERDAAAAEFKKLYESLSAALLGDSASGPFINLERESAAARFLVRARLGQYHPQDAKRLRLIDFSRELDD